MRAPSLRLALIAATALVALSAGARAQSAPSPAPTATQMLSIGPAFAGGASMLLDPAENWKVRPVFAWRLTIDANYPFSEAAGAWLSLGIDRRGGEFYWYDDETVTERRMVNYFALTPGINIKGMVIGLNIGFPMSGARTYTSGADGVERTLELDSDIDELGVLLEPCIFGAIPLMDTELGWLGITVGAGYALSETSDDPGFMPGETPGQTYSSNTVSAHLGLQFLFGIPGTAR